MIKAKAENAILVSKKPQLGEVCKFWDDEKDGFVIGVLSGINQDHSHLRYMAIEWYLNCEPVNPNTTLAEVFGKEVTK